MITNRLYEVRWHGRGGQGVVTAAMILAEAAYYEGFKGVTGTPFFGAERRGVPVVASNRFARESIRTLAQIENPGVVVVLDERLLDLADATVGLESDGLIIVNTPQAPEDVFRGADFSVATSNVTQIARRIGLVEKGNVMINTSMIGAFSKASGLVSLENIERAIRTRFPAEAASLNIEGARLAFDKTMINKK